MKIIKRTLGVGRKPAGKVKLKLLDENRREIPNVMVVINEGKKVVVTAVAVDQKDRVLPFDEVPEWTVSPTGGVSLFPTPDGTACDIVAIGTGTQVVTVKAKAAGKVISATLDVQSVAAEVIPTLKLTVGPEVDV